MEGTNRGAYQLTGERIGELSGSLLPRAHSFVTVSWPVRNVAPSRGNYSAQDRSEAAVNGVSYRACGWRARHVPCQYVGRCENRPLEGSGRYDKSTIVSMRAWPVNNASPFGLTY
ncbi:ABC transporter related protein [Anopheles sinensis]|uniref:ABC transporter related protein n=1 Tax=Anopheles sinensis TaxID=74873 RepID=A0A084WK95_ANOSI|nr:ABC transporter related protein [Anopheles sinensis]